MIAFHSRLIEIHPKTRAGWRSWLQKNHSKREGVWLVYFKSSTGKRKLSWEDAVKEALCFGWIDSMSKSIDETRYKQVFTPRKPTSVWSKINKNHVASLLEAALMAEAGLKAVEVAKSNGMWSMLEPVDALIVPSDLELKLQENQRDREAYETLSKAEKRALLYSIYSAKRQETRDRRLEKALSALRAGSPPSA